MGRFERNEKLEQIRLPFGSETGRHLRKKMLKIRMIFHRNTHMTKLIRPKFGEHDQKIDEEN